MNQPDACAVEGVSFRTLPGRGVNLNVACAGPDDGPLVVLLHGFPEFWFCWRCLIGPLVQAGFRVVAPDQRGYNLSDKPGGVGSYVLDLLVEDVVALIDACGRDRAFVVAHDWGGVVSWHLASRHPERVSQLVVMNAPHPAVIQRSLRRSLSQIGRSWYVFAFQLPWLPEWLLRRRRFRAMRAMLTRSSRPGTFSESELDCYVQAWARPDALPSMLSWYRAAIRKPSPTTSRAPISVPTLLLWGVQDVALGLPLARESAGLCQQVELVLFEDATHWLPHEKPAEVAERTIAFFRSGNPGS